MIVLIIILFSAQGGLVQKYDVKCLGELEKDTNKCPTEGLNAFYAGDLYYELDTMKFWEEADKNSRVCITETVQKDVPVMENGVAKVDGDGKAVTEKKDVTQCK
jgi:hypothetical protein